jgi:hypothetical protein
VSAQKLKYNNKSHFTIRQDGGRWVAAMVVDFDLTKREMRHDKDSNNVENQENNQHKILQIAQIYIINIRYSDNNINRSRYYSLCFIFSTNFIWKNVCALYVYFLCTITMRLFSHLGPVGQ